jgi:hypothetical protein
MAGRGPAPKDPAKRRNRHPPARGEWVDLQWLEEPCLPEAEPYWSEPVRRLWDRGWRWDPVAATFGPAEREALYLLAQDFDSLPPNEQRLRMDGLGLTLKGKRDLRFRLPAPGAAAAEPERPRLAEVRRLKAIA